MKKKEGQRGTIARCTRQMKEQLHRAWRTERMRRDGPWAPCEIIITLHDDPRHNAV